LALMTTVGWRLVPQFLDGRRGRLFAMAVSAVPPRKDRQCVLMIAPLGEEMNKCRPMLAMQARALAVSGIDTVLLDPYGTGDSSGEFADATWEIWADDICRGWDSLSAAEPRFIHVLAIRSGALLLNALAERRKLEGSRIVLWQPVVRGSDYWRNVLRMRLAALSGRDNVREIETPESVLTRDGGIEIAGYRYSSGLVESLNKTNVSPELLLPANGLLWIEITASSGATMSPGASRVVQQWRGMRLNVETSVHIGEPFWATPEISLAPPIATTTNEFFLRSGASS